MYDVFVSYATPDVQVADAIVHHLESIGIRCFIAPRDMRVGPEWKAQLVAGIRACKALVLVLSEHSNDSEPVRNEVFYAVSRGLFIIPFKIQEVELHDSLVFDLMKRHWLNALTPPLALRIQELGGHLCNLLNHVPVAVFPPQAKSIESQPPVRPPSLGDRLATTGNSLGMKFAPIPNEPGGLQVLGCIHPTRSRDFAAFIADKNRGYKMNDDNWRTFAYQSWPVGRGKGERAEDSAHPAICVSHDDAKAFTAWLTRQERSKGRIGPKDEYRLPTDHEWSLMVGLGEEKGSTPAEKSKNGDTTHFPWGGVYPPTGKVGNYADETAKKAFGWSSIPGYDDGFATTSPVMSFPANGSGFYDLGGNVWEWCEDWYNSDQTHRVLRGASWGDGGESFLVSSRRNRVGPVIRGGDFGFRCLLVVVGG